MPRSSNVAESGRDSSFSYASQNHQQKKERRRKKKKDKKTLGRALSRDFEEGITHLELSLALRLFADKTIVFYIA
jgi:hypothetical protein